MLQRSSRFSRGPGQLKTETTASRRTRGVHERRLSLEALEQRTLLSVSEWRFNDAPGKRRPTRSAATTATW